MQIEHIAACPDVSHPDCEEYEIPDHMHHQGVQWFRSSLSANVGLGKGWQVLTDIPFDLKFLSIEYTLDGEPYDPPYAGIHHRDETLFGLSDPSLMVQRFQGFGDAFVLGLGLGSRIPLGKTEEDPFTLGEQGKEHQHFQRGTGTFVPIGSANLYWMGLRWRSMAWVQGSLPLYESKNDYKPSSSLSYGLTEGYRATPNTQITAMTQVQHDGPESWNGDTSNSPGRDLVMVGLGALQMLKPGLVLQGQIRTTVWQHTQAAHVEDQLVQKFLITAGVSWTPGDS